MSKQYIVLETTESGGEIRQYENGDIRNERGQLLERPERIADNTITAETSAHMRQLRKQKYMDAIENGVKTAINTPTAYDAIGKIIGKRAQIALNDDSRTGNDATKIVLQALDALQDKQTTNEQVTRQVYEIDPETVRIVEQMMAVRRSEK